MPAYDDGSTPTLVTEKPPAVAMTQFGDDVAGTLTARYDSSPCADRGQNIVVIQGDGGTSNGEQHGMGVNTDGVSYTLNNMDRHSIAYAVRMRAGCDGGGKGALVQEGVSGTLATGNDQTLFQPESSGYVVRRLTPLECERLQGFPDGWTDIGEWVDSKGKTRSTTDGARYKALGNSFAVPVVRWLGERIQSVTDQ